MALDTNTRIAVLVITLGLTAVLLAALGGVFRILVEDQEVDIEQEHTEFVLVAMVALRAVIGLFLAAVVVSVASTAAWLLTAWL